MKYAFIEESQTQFPVLRLCQVLRVSRSGFYAWLGRPESKRSVRNRHLANEIKRVHDQHDQNYGAPISGASIHEWMQEQGFTKLTYEEELALLGNEEPLAGENIPSPVDDE